MLTATQTKKCRVCSGTFTPFRPLQSVCGLTCARKVPVIDRKAAKALTARRKEAVKTRGDFMKEAQIAFNTFIRTRDAGESCICCGASLTDSAVGGGFDCGHYRSVGSAPHLRFDPDNAHGQTKKCNRYGAGRAVDYRRGLIARRGANVVDRLESDQSSPKWSIEELKAIRDDFRQRTRDLIKARENQ